MTATAPEWLPALLGALPWVVGPVVIAWRLRDSSSLEDESTIVPPDAPVLSVVVPARDERRNIGRCVRSLLASTYPRLEVIVVDDHSADATADAARDAGGDDPRLRVIANPDLPAGWFGKQWACANGARAARGELLLFTDADTWHAPELHARAVNALFRRDAALLTVAGRQELGGFWERAVQPQVFAIIGGRYGGTERINRSPRVRDKIANGQFLLMRRDAYERLDGHAAVRHTVVEDLALAQHWFQRGERTAMVLGLRQLSTRMYESFGELVRGWGKNVFAGGREAMPGGLPGRLLFPLLLPVPALLQLAPVLALLLGALGLVTGTWTLWGALATGCLLAFWAGVYREAGLPAYWALAFPAGAAALLYIVVRATLRGSRVEWKGRAYRSV